MNKDIKINAVSYLNERGQKGMRVNVALGVFENNENMALTKHPFLNT